MDSYLWIQFPIIEFRLPEYRKKYSIRVTPTRRERKTHKVSHRKRREIAGRFTRHEHNWDKQRCSITDLKIAKAKQEMDKYYWNYGHKND